MKLALQAGSMSWLDELALQAGLTSWLDALVEHTSSSSSQVYERTSVRSTSARHRRALVEPARRASFIV